MSESRVPLDVSGRALRLRDVDLDTFLHPTTVAVIGASEASRKPNAAMTLRIKQWADAHGASFFPVHPVYETVLGERCYASIDDVGRCINPLIVHGQTHGAIVQGVGQAMWEQFYVDPDTGQPLTGSFMDYAMPRSDKLPSFSTEIVEVLSPTNPLGIKAGGEGGTTGAPAVIISGIVDALRGFGIRDITMPATPWTVWKAIRDAKAR